MRTELPKKWCIKRDKDNDMIITNYINKISGFDHNSFALNDNNPYLHNKKGCSSNNYPFSDYIEITFEEFERLVLNKLTEPQYEVY